MVTAAFGGVRAACIAGRAALAAGLLGCLVPVSLAQLDLHYHPDSQVPRGNTRCADCGEVRSVREVHQGVTSSVPPPAPNTFLPQQQKPEWVVGAAIVMPFGRGGDKEPVRIGGMGTPDMQQRFGETSYEITVLMDDGDRRVVQRRDGARFPVGERVSLRSGQLEVLYK